MKFKRQDYFKHKRLKIKWKRPKGRQSKLRVKKSGSGMKVSIGYGSPKKEKPVLIKTLADMESLKKDDKIIIQGTIGLRKLDHIVEKAKKMGLIITNKRRIEKIAKIKEEIKKKKEAQAKAKKKAEKEKKKEEEEKPAEKKPAKEEPKKEEKKEEKKTQPTDSSLPKESDKK